MCITAMTTVIISWVVHAMLHSHIVSNKVNQVKAHYMYPRKSHSKFEIV